MRITVYHPRETAPGNGERTEFSGDGLDYRVEDGGHLRVTQWETDAERGDALFAAGAWNYVCRSRARPAT